jgi:Patatin-like phospholipase
MVPLLSTNLDKRMDVQSAIAEYKRLSPEIFHQSVTRYAGSNIAKTAVGMPWFKGEALEAGVKRIIVERISWEEKEGLGADASEARLISNIEGTREKSCKTYVSPCQHLVHSLTINCFRFLCALKKEDNSAVRFRAYPIPGGGTTPFGQCKIWEAARATSAAPFYFPTAVVNGVKFWDGGLANNNPVLEVLGERSQLFPQRPINCLISLGTGFSERKPTKSALAVLGKGKRVLKNVTNVNINHERAREQTANDNVPYFRFNPSTAEDEIGLADYKLLDALTGHTERFLDREDVKLEIKQCAELLFHRSDTPPQPPGNRPDTELGREGGEPTPVQVEPPVGDGAEVEDGA